jgi:transposase
MAVRGLGCPVRFTITAGQRGDAPQAEPLIGELPAEVAMADAAYDSDRLRQKIAEKGAVAVIPNTPLSQKLSRHHHRGGHRPLVTLNVHRA